MVYLADRIVMSAWLMFPVFFSYFVVRLCAGCKEWIIRVVRFVIFPTALVLILLYQWEPATIKVFSRGDHGLWYASTGVFPLWMWISRANYLLTGILFFCMLRQWTGKDKQRVTNKHKIRFLLLHASMFTLGVAIFFTEIMLPLSGVRSFPILVHIMALPVIAVLQYQIRFMESGALIWHELSNLFVDRVRQFVMFLDKDARIYSVNQFTAEVLQYKPGELSSKTPENLVLEYGLLREQLDLAANNMTTSKIRCSLLKKNGEAVPVMLSLVKLHDNLRNVVGFILVGLDYRKKLALRDEVRERSRIELELNALADSLEYRVEKRNRELKDAKKELALEIRKIEQAATKIQNDLQVKGELLREIHHRVKNNIQVVISLINMSGAQNKLQPGTGSLFAGLAQRVRDISLVHEYMYDSPLLGKINFARFIAKVTNELAMRKLSDSNVYFKLKIDEENISIDQAIPCGMIVYELLRNSLTYAFSSEMVKLRPVFAYSVVHIAFSRNNGDYELMVRDNGMGMELDAAGLPVKCGVGLCLIEILVRQYLAGEISYFNDNGTKIIVRFRDKDIKPGERT